MEGRRGQNGVCGVVRGAVWGVMVVGQRGAVRRLVRHSCYGIRVGRGSLRGCGGRVSAPPGRKACLCLMDMGRGRFTSQRHARAGVSRRLNVGLPPPLSPLPPSTRATPTCPGGTPTPTPLRGGRSFTPTTAKSERPGRAWRGAVMEGAIPTTARCHLACVHASVLARRDARVRGMPSRGRVLTRASPPMPPCPAGGRLARPSGGRPSRRRPPPRRT